MTEAAMKESIIEGCCRYRAPSRIKLFPMHGPGGGSGYELRSLLKLPKTVENRPANRFLGE